MTITDVVLNPPIPLNEKKTCCGFGQGSELCAFRCSTRHAGHHALLLHLLYFSINALVIIRKLQNIAGLYQMCRLSLIVCYQPTLHPVF